LIFGAIDTYSYFIKEIGLNILGLTYVEEIFFKQDLGKKKKESR